MGRCAGVREALGEDGVLQQGTVCVHRPQTQVLRAALYQGKQRLIQM